MSDAPVPEDRCGFELRPEDIGSEQELEEFREGTRAVCCWRETWQDGRCLWHADTTDKPVDELVAEAENEPDKRVDGAIVRHVHLNRRISFADWTLTGAQFENVSLEGAEFPDADLGGANFPGADLQGAAFSDADLRGATFPDADLQEAEFPDADLGDARFPDADLQGAAFPDADLWEAEFPRASLREVAFPDAYLPESEFPDADLKGAEFTHADLEDAEFPGADVLLTEFADASLRSAEFPDAFLFRAEFPDASLQEARFPRADLTGARFPHADLRGAEFPDALLTETEFSHASLTEAAFLDADLSLATITDTDLTDADLTGADLQETTLSGATFLRATLTNATLPGGDVLREAAFPEANLQNHDLREANLSGVDFKKADLTDADLSRADLSKANLERALLNRADVFDTCFAGARLDGAVFGDVQINEGTFEHLEPETDDAEQARNIVDRVVSLIAGPTGKDSYRCVYDPASPFKVPETEAGDEAPDDEAEHSGTDADTSEDEPDTEKPEPRTRASGVYRQFEQLAANNALPEWQQDFFILRQDMQTRQKTGLDRWFALVQRALFGYGESFGRVVGWAGGIIVAFAVLYLLGGWIQPVTSGGATGDPVSWTQLPGDPSVLWESLYYSTLTFTALGFGDFRPRGSIGQLLTIVETASGALLLALLVFVLGRRAAR